MNSDKKKWNKTDKYRKIIEKENNNNESDFSENEWDTRFEFFEAFWIWAKKNIVNINSSSSYDEEEGAEYKVKRISNNQWCKWSAKAAVGRCYSK